VQLFRDIVAPRTASRAQGAYLLAIWSPPARCAGVTVYGSWRSSKRKGAPLDWFVAPPAGMLAIRAQGSRAMRRIPHAALLFLAIS